MKTVEPGRLLICRQKSTSRVVYGHVNAFPQSLPMQCCSNQALDTPRRERGQLAALKLTDKAVGR